MAITTRVPTLHRPAAAPIEDAALPQYSLGRIGAIWAAAALPMAFLSWVLAPWLADRIDGPNGLTKALLLCLTAGLVWQFVLVAIVVFREQGTLRWSVVRPALWLTAPRSPSTGRRGGRLWLLLIPLVLLYFVLVRSMEERLKREVSNTRPAADAVRAGEAALARGDARAALPQANAAVVAEPANAAGWRLMARAANAIEPRDYRERWELRERAISGPPGAA
jgi:hypothetical protein